MILSENHRDLSTVHNEDSGSVSHKSGPNSQDPYKNKSFIDTRFRGTKYFDFGALIGQVREG